MTNETIKSLLSLNYTILNSNNKNIFNSFFDFLKENFFIDAVKILVKNSGNSDIVFDNSDENTQLFYTKKVRTNGEFEIIFGLIFKDQSKLQEVKSKYSLQIDLVLNNLSNILYIKYLEKELLNATTIDKLTGCYTRAYLNNIIKPIFSLATRENKKVAFLKIGIDHFKAVLDEFNYNIGDKVIKKLSLVIKNCIRESDFVIRMSNDAFLVILQNIKDEDNAILVANKIINKFKDEKVVVNETTGQVLMKTICAGITYFPKDGKDINTIIKKADIAVREAKNNGRSRAFVFSEEETSKIELF
ncbi:Cyclic di-GMP phosphodiesterase Gmr [Aliarcobacter thereius]|uniref:Cyclic di-GMP phosphodiesterase Gmr n=1 Tax=Aliarcobacter thereius TaxID=544718 RepID=A0A1C0B715_9BACT|nr:GGDEF domain-containing protein [Aliarcobacter thereius]OCL86917.1 Cyclic di-GMP phosphodiesterase Gmr [Aliarcobacter thereius]OCL99380.1 Cyclic di-GMP phosphodiesterase Gmr [Aliarcobacter thereius]TLT07217.1 GGDEF domain-containing protein [Aliarcobacter thereius]HJE02925.1 GGDEF domain-containing protein [Aliarcobacter thereius]